MKKWFTAFLLALTVLSISTIVADTNLVQAAEKTMYVNAKSDIVLREKPEKNAKQIGTVKNKSQVKVISISKGWAYINTGTKKGYVYESALTAKNPSTTVKGGLLPKDGLKLTYSPDFLSQQKSSTYRAEKMENGTVYLSNNNEDTFVYGEDKKGLGITLCECGWFLLDVEYPFIQGKYTTEYHEGESYDGPILVPSKILVESTTATVKVKAGTFKNVVILKTKSGGKYYLAPGVGLIKAIDIHGKVILELSKVE